ncbi:MAG: filamentous hemagglutinin family protein, partial [Planctomycetota bacterium]
MLYFAHHDTLFRNNPGPDLSRYPASAAPSRVLLFLLVASCSSLVNAAPEGGQIVAGSGSINQAQSVTDINQNTQSMVVDWQSFNVNRHETVNFNQPSSSATALNRIYDQNPSQIFGSLNANGRVFLSNPNGLIFGADSVVNVGALLATSLNIDADRFMQGDYQLSSALAESGAVVNYGLLQAATGGSISLLGSQVENHGVIVANYGQVNLLSGSQATVSFDGNGLINFRIDEGVIKNALTRDNAIHNTGQIH